MCWYVQKKKIVHWGIKIAGYNLYYYFNKSQEWKKSASLILLQDSYQDYLNTSTYVDDMKNTLRLSVV